jgi:transposase-like protein
VDTFLRAGYYPSEEVFMSSKRIQYTQEVKNSAVKLMTEQGYKLSETSRSLGGNVSVLRRWKKAAEPSKKANGGKLSTSYIQGMGRLFSSGA